MSIKNQTAAPPTTAPKPPTNGASGRPRRNAQRWRHHGRHQRRTSPHRRKKPALAPSWPSNAFLAGHPQGRRRRPHAPSKVIREIMKTVTIPSWPRSASALRRAEVLQALEVDFIDESEVLTPRRRKITSGSTIIACPSSCGARNLGEAVRRIAKAPP